MGSGEDPEHGSRWEPQGGFRSSGGMRLAAHQGSSLRYAIGGSSPVPVPARCRQAAVGTDRRRRTGVEHRAAAAHTSPTASGQPHWEYPHAVCRTVGTQPWQHCMRVFSVPDFAVVAHVVVQNAAASGTLWVDDLRLTPAVEKSSTFVWRALFGTLWCGILACCVWTAGLPRQKLGVAMLAVGILIIAGVAAPEPALERIVNRGAQAANGLVNGHFANPDPPPSSSPIAQRPCAQSRAVPCSRHHCPREGKGCQEAGSLCPVRSACISWLSRRRLGVGPANRRLASSRSLRHHCGSALAFRRGGGDRAVSDCDTRLQPCWTGPSMPEESCWAQPLP